MDALKTGEVKRMELGGNKPWKDFFNSHSSNTTMGREFDQCTISERYDSEAGEEWKERLTAKVEGVEYVPGTSKPVVRAKQATVESANVTPAGSGRNTPLSRMASPPQRTASPSQKARNEQYFARMGEQNAHRPNDLPPSQGGKYGGFGSSPAPSSSNPNAAGGSVPTADDFQKDPVAALTKGFGWLSSTVTKQAATVHKSYIQPGLKSVQDGEFAAQAQKLGTQGWQGLQQGTKGIGEQFNKFVDPEHPGAGGSAGRQRVQPERKDFWDDFAAAGESAQQKASKPTSIGTAAMKPGAGGGAGGAAARGEEDAGWKDW